MKDQIAPRLPAGRGVTQDKVFPTLVGMRGIPRTDGMLPSTSGQTSARGGLIPSTTSGVVESPKKAPVCGGTNKKGLPCGARPVKGKGYCVGHLRAIG